MKKSTCRGSNLHISRRWVVKFLLMKFFIGCLLLTSLQVVAFDGFSQKRINLDLKNTSISSVLDKIESRYDYRFLYDENLKLGSIKMDFHAKDATLEEVMQQLLQSTSLFFKKINNNLVVIAGNNSDNVAAKAIKGKIINDKGEPISFASVIEKGTTNGVTTADDGSFGIDVKDENAVLVISAVGYASQEVPVKGTGFLNIVLKSTESKMDEVVVVGYGTQKKSELIGSVSQVSGKNINNRAVGQLSQAMTGQMPGVTVIQRSGQPGVGATIQIRGVGSFGATPNALILLDGVPTGSFNDIDPNDVENISVLKDASTAAIYGSRAANGVILVTTKSGSINKMTVSYNGYVGSQRLSATPEYVSSWEFATLMNEAVPGSYTQEQIQKFREGSDPDNYPNSDYINSVFKKGTLQTGHNVSLSYGNEKVQYVLSSGYVYQNGIVAKNDYNRYNLRLNLTTKISQKLKFTTRLSAIQTFDNQPVTPATLDQTGMIDIISNAIRYPSIYGIKMSNGDWGGGVVNKGNPVAWLESKGFFKSRGIDLAGNARFDWQVFPSLKLSAIGAYTQGQNEGKTFLATQRINANIFLGPSSLSQSSGYSNYKTFQALAEYTKRIVNHEINVLGGYSFESSHSETLSGYRGDLPSNDLPSLNLGDPGTQTNDFSANEYALQSLFGRLQYNFQKKYLVEGTIRYDGSSRFPIDRKYASFPAVAIGWRISQENFIKDNINWINDLKLKASYGTLGNQNIGNYPYQNLLVTGSNYPFGGSLFAGAARTTITDTTLHWESTRTKDIGFDATLFKNKLTFGATYFDRYTYDILASPGGSVSFVLGFGVGRQNSGKLSNKGWEFTLGYRDAFNDFSYWINSNLTILKNTILDLGVGNTNQPNGMVGNPAIGFIGYTYGMYYGYVAEGLFKDVEDVTNWRATYSMPTVNPNPQPGDIKYKDISGPDGVPDGKVDANYDRIVLGSNIPKYSYGATLGFSYKGVDLSALIQGVSGVTGYLTDYAGWAFYQGGSVQRWQADSHWSPENPDPKAAYPRLELISNQGSPNIISSSFWTLNGAYWRIRNIQLGYSIPQSLLKTTLIKGIRINVSAENLFTKSHYRQGWDPEINVNLRGNYYPILKNYTIGLNVNF